MPRRPGTAGSKSPDDAAHHAPASASLAGHKSYEEMSRNFTSERLIRARTDSILKRLMGLHPRRIDLTLSRMRRLMSALGHPERALPPVIHVAGTNGKGSTIAFLRAMLEAAGRRVHVYTSPHLIRFSERILLADEKGARSIAETWLAELLEECEAANAGAPVTFFEITTAAAFLAFSRRPADVLLLEVGLGGRLDATNVVENVAASVITPVAIDHQEYLGGNLRQIAAEKAGIIRPGVPVVVGPQEEDAWHAIAERATELGAPLFAANRDWQAFEQHGRLVWEDERALYDLPMPALAGRFQIDNAGLAIAALRLLGDAAITEEAIAEGLLSVRWPGRLQPVRSGALRLLVNPDDEIWIDGGHNAHAARALAAAMADLEDTAPMPLVLVLGMQKNRDPQEYLRHFAGLAAQVIGVPLPEASGEMGQGRAPEELAAAACRAGLAARAAPTLEQALRQAARLRPDSPVRIVIAGSLHLAGAALARNEDAS